MNKPDSTMSVASARVAAVAATISRAQDLPSPRREAFVWRHVFHRGFSLTADISGWPSMCAEILRVHRRKPIRLTGAVQDLEGTWHLVGTERCCSTTTAKAHRRATTGEVADPANIPAAQRCPNGRAVWPGYLGVGIPHRAHRLAAIAALGDRCTICSSRPGQVLDHDHATGATRGHLDRECNQFVERCRHLDGCDFAEYLNAGPPRGLGIYPAHGQVMRQMRYRSRRIAFDVVMAGGTSPGVGNLIRRNDGRDPWHLEIPEGLPDPLPLR